MNTILQPTSDFPYPSIELSADKLVALVESLMAAGVRYELGAKVDPLSLQAGEFNAVDCSGFTRWALFHASDHELLIPDGSVNQHAWLEGKRFKVSGYEAGKLKDGAVRMAVLTPEDGGGVGHVLLIVDGLTLESHGHKGPDRRPWGDEFPFMAKMSVYVLTPPEVKT